MHSIEEKRVYGDRTGALEAYVASANGVVRVRIAGDTVGEFSLCERCDTRDVAAVSAPGDGRVAIATADDVRVLERAGGADSKADREDVAFVGTGFGPAVAVGFDGTDPVAAGPDGTVARRTDETWDPLEGDVGGTVRAIDGDLVGTDSGVYRVHDGSLDHAGLTDVRDVSAPGVPLAATATGCYKLGNGWVEVLDGPFETVAADPRTEPGSLARAHAVSDGTLYAVTADGDWRVDDRPPEPIVDVGYGDAVYAVTERGTVLTASDDGTETGTWRSRSLGIGDVTGMAVTRSE
ncbi:HVO_0234 family beta-propeller protein [Halopiger djelfimassiliensis]|uniref:HVO_0234 family beta-propeller protein n=1 Tax=Halopiger djelfimassiliensis TaxID=1293047 RepID=UPI0006778470|nr:hypothetical protein [Halopiger djelfimassiliensis]